METYICEFELIQGKELTYSTKQRNFQLAQSAFGTYCAKNGFKPIRGWKWRMSGSKVYLNSI